MRSMSVHVYGVNYVAIQVNDLEKAKAFYRDVFNLELQNGGEGDAFFKVGEHQFMASGSFFAKTASMPLASIE